MAFGSFDSGRGQNQSTLSEINMVPLIDVMLVLLVIFIITAPLLAHSIKIDVPQVSSQAIEQDPKSVDIAVDAQGVIFVNESPMDMSNLREYFVNTAKLDPSTEFRIRADADTRYELIAKIMAAAKGSGVKKLGFITSPAPEQSQGNGVNQAPEQRQGNGVNQAPEQRQGNGIN